MHRQSCSYLRKNQGKPQTTPSLLLQPAVEGDVVHQADDSFRGTKTPDEPTTQPPTPISQVHFFPLPPYFPNAAQLPPNHGLQHHHDGHGYRGGDTPRDNNSGVLTDLGPGGRRGVVGWTIPINIHTRFVVPRTAPITILVSNMSNISLHAQTPTAFR